MAKLQVPSGTTSKRIAIFVQDSSSTTGAGLTGLAFGTSGLVCYSWIDTDGNAGGTSQALQTATLGTWTTRGFKEKDATNLPGFYEFGVPDALLAAGVKWAVLMFKGATNMAPLVLEIEVTAVSNQDAVRGGMTALPNANAEAAGGLYTRGSGAGQINQAANGQIDVNAEAWNTLATVALPLIPTVAGRTLDVSAGGEAGVDWANVGSPTTSLALTGTTIAVTQKVDVDTIKTNPVVNAGTITFPTTATLASTTNITAGTITTATTATNLTNAPTAGDLTAAMKASVTTAATAATPVAASVTGAVGSVTGNVGGNVTGSVGSVVGAVGSVTGAVGSVTGNVGGSVASVTAAVAVTSNVKKNQALSKFQFLMTDSTNHSPATGKTVTCTRSIDGGAFGAGALANVTEISNGTYTVDFGSADLNGNVIVLRATAASCDDTFEQVITQP